MSNFTTASPSAPRRRAPSRPRPPRPSPSPQRPDPQPSDRPRSFRSFPATSTRPAPHGHGPSHSEAPHQDYRPSHTDLSENPLAEPDEREPITHVRRTRQLDHHRTRLQLRALLLRLEHYLAAPPLLHLDRRDVEPTDVRREVRDLLVRRRLPRGDPHDRPRQVLRPRDRPRAPRLMRGTDRHELARPLDRNRTEPGFRPRIFRLAGHRYTVFQLRSRTILDRTGCAIPNFCASRSCD